MRRPTLHRLRGAAWLAALAVAGLLAQAAEPKHVFVIGEKDFLLDGKPFAIRSGELHYARIPREHWPHRLRMAKALGLNTVSTYVFLPLGSHLNIEHFARHHRLPRSHFFVPACSRLKTPHLHGYCPEVHPGLSAQGSAHRTPCFRCRLVCASIMLNIR